MTGYAVGNPMNLLTVLAVYASLCRELGLSLRFPGTTAAYDALYQVTDAALLARATIWAADTVTANRQIFNVTNGDQFRWRHMFPHVAQAFDLELAEPIPFSLAEHMGDKALVWERIAARHGLRDTPFDKLGGWQFGDFLFGADFDNVTSTVKVRKAGFHDCYDTAERFNELFAKLRIDRVIP